MRREKKDILFSPKGENRKECSAGGSGFYKEKGGYNQISGNAVYCISLLEIHNHISLLNALIKSCRETIYQTGEMCSLALELNGLSLNLSPAKNEASYQH